MLYNLNLFLNFNDEFFNNFYLFSYLLIYSPFFKNFKFLINFLYYSFIIYKYLISNYEFNFIKYFVILDYLKYSKVYYLIH